jgi:hypothetical protein
MFIVAAALPTAVGIHVYVDAAKGDDRRTGIRISESVASLRRARDAIRELRIRERAPSKSATVHLAPTATYTLSSPLLLNASDSKVHWQGNGALISGGVPIPSSLMEPVPSDDPNWHKFQNVSLIRRVVLSRVGLGPEDVGQLATVPVDQPACTNLSRMEIFAGGSALTLARYPDLPYADRYHGSWMHVEGVDVPGTFVGAVPRQRAERWSAELHDLWLHGYWNFECAQAFPTAMCPARSWYHSCAASPCTC